MPLAACGDAGHDPTAAASTAAELTGVDAADAGAECGDASPTAPGSSDMVRPEEALQAYICMRRATSSPVQLTLRGDPLTIEYQIK